MLSKRWVRMARHRSVVFPSLAPTSIHYQRSYNPACGEGTWLHLFVLFMVAFLLFTPLVCFYFIFLFFFPHSLLLWEFSELLFRFSANSFRLRFFIASLSPAFIPGCFRIDMLPCSSWLEKRRKRFRFQNKSKWTFMLPLDFETVVCTLGGEVCA